MDKKIIKNYLYNLSYQLLTILVPLITTPYVSRVLGADGIGTFSYTNSIVQYFILFGCIGLNLYGQREIAYAQKNTYKRDKTFYELVILRIITVGISVLLYLILFFHNNKYSTIFIIMSLDIFASMIDISWFFQGIEDFKKIVIRNFIVKIIGVCLIFTFIKTYDDLLLYIICHSATLFLGNLSMWLYIPKIVTRVKFNNLDIIKHIKPTLTIFIPQIAISLYTIFDKTMIGLLTGNTAEVAYYEQAQKIIKIVLTIVTSLTTVMMPRIANLYHENNLEKVKQYVLLSIKFIFVLAFPMTFGIMGLSNNLVPWFFGDGFAKVSLNMMIISPIIIAISFSGLFGTQYLLAIGRQKEYTISVITGTLINFILNLLFICQLGSYGAAIATVIAEFCVLLIQLYFVKQEYTIKDIISGNLKYVFASLVMFIPIFVLSNTFKSTIFTTFIITIFGIIIYFFVLLVLFRDKDLMYFVHKFIKKIN